jgi:hypothetical protein
MKEENEDFDIQHRLLIEEEEIDEDELPLEIQKAIRAFDIKLDRFEETNDARLFLELQQDDVAIADDIQTFIEDGESDEDDEDDSYADDADDADDDDDDEDDEDDNSKATQQSQVTQTATLTDIEKLVLENIKENKISVEKLQQILKREPDYPNQIIGKIRLRKLYLKPFYEAF